MKTRAEVSPEKLRGGFYTPPELVRFCLDRIATLVPAASDLRVLEPSVGDGAFIRGIAASPLRAAVGSVLGFEIIPKEGHRAGIALEEAGLPGAIRLRSTVEWGSETSELFDVAVGNPPFVRFQFIETEDKLALRLLGERLGISFGGVGNLWIPILLASLARLRAGGSASFVIPTECLTGVSARVVRKWLIRHFSNLRLDLFPPGSFPRVLQEVLVLSGTRREEPAEEGSLRIVEHTASSDGSAWEHRVEADERSWSRYLLQPKHLLALEEARALPMSRPLGEIAVLEVSIVTGANDYFSVDRETLREFELTPWAKPLLPRLRHASGLIYRTRDQEATAEAGARAWLLHFAENLPDPTRSRMPRAYLNLGEVADLHTRYKCRIRTPWYRVPSVKPGRLLLSKRSHRFHRLVLNDVGALTTDTIYRGWMRPNWQSYERALVASFHNSLTLLTAELEGRSFGGGVLELVPSEIGRLTVPLITELGSDLPRLDRLLRDSNSDEALVEATDDLLTARNAGLSHSLFDVLRDARESLLARRLGRNSRALSGAEHTRLAA